MDLKRYVRILWTVLLTLFMIFLDADIDNLTTLASNSAINVYICTASFVFYLICGLFGLHVLCLLISGLIFMSFIFVALFHEGEYFYIYYICLFIFGLLSRERHVLLFLKSIVLVFNFALLLDIVTFAICKSKV